MPVLDLTEWQKDPKSTWFRLGEIMIFPDNEQLRKLYRNRALLEEFAARETRYTMPYALGDIPPGFFENVQQMMDVNLDEKTKIRSTYGPMVGGVLMFMKQMSLSGSMSRKQAFKQSPRNLRRNCMVLIGT